MDAELSWQVRCEQLEAENADLQLWLKYTRYLLGTALYFVVEAFYDGHPETADFPGLIEMMKSEVDKGEVG